MAEQKMTATELKKIWTVKKLEDDTLIITSYKGNETDVVIPSEIGKNTVSALGEDVFSLRAARLTKEQMQARRNIKSITVPGTIKEIPANMCYASPLEGNVALEKVIIEEGVEVINSNAFQRCVNLKEVVLPQTIKRIVGGAFVCCESLEKIDIPDGVEELGGFNGCKKLMNIHIPKGIQTLTHYFFAGMEIEKFVVPDHITCIETHAFEGCERLKEVVIPSGCMKIGAYCFCGCKELEMPRIPDGATIGQNAFKGCDKLVDENGFIVVVGVFYGYIPKGNSGVVRVPDYIKDFPIDFLREPYSVVYKCGSATHKPLPDLSAIKSGDEIEFGLFPADESLELKPLLWKVLKVDGDKALIMTRDSIMSLDRMNTQKRTWEECSTRIMLNGDFFDGAFSDEERSIILNSKLDNPNNKKHKTPGGNPTEDKVFLLSLTEIEDVLPNKEERTGEITAYAKLQTYAKRDNVVFWVTRTPGDAGWGPVAISDFDGDVDYEGNHVGYNAVRPAMWISIK